MSFLTSPRTRRGRTRTYVMLALAVVLVVIVGFVSCVRTEIQTDPQSSGPGRAVATGFRGCPPEGDGGDPVLNRLKNRVDYGEWRTVSLDSILKLTWPEHVERRDRARWTAAETRAVSRAEGMPVSVEGYFVGVKQEGPESPNCHGADSEFRDWHIWMAARPGKDRRQSVVVETTPVMRAQRSGWTLAAVRKLARDSTRVRVSGWLLLDPEHPDQIGKTRGTIWEIHPVLVIEAWRGGRWAPLE